jgi:hypothetical protein
MSMKVYQSVQPILAYKIQRYFLDNHYLYVAEEYDPVGNHFTSRPKLIARKWCRVASGIGLPSDLEDWERVKRTLHTALVNAFVGTVLRKAITLSQLIEGQRLISTATIEDALPVLFEIPAGLDGFTLKRGDHHEGYEDTEKEYLIPDLDPQANFEIRVINCYTS